MMIVELGKIFVLISVILSEKHDNELTRQYIDAFVTEVEILRVYIEQKIEDTNGRLLIYELAFTTDNAHAMLIFTATACH